MIDPSIIHLNYIKKEPQSGSDRGLRYLFVKGKDKSGDCLEVTAWPEPLCYGKTPAHLKESRTFPLSEDGIREAADWLNGWSARRAGARPEA